MNHIKDNIFSCSANEGINRIQPYYPAKPIGELEKELGLEEIIMLAKNENAFGPSAKAIEAIKKSIQLVGNYPDSDGLLLKNKIVQKFKTEIALCENQIVLGNGSSEILSLLAQAFLNSNTEVIFSQYAFIVYKLVSQLQNAKIVEVPALNWGTDLERMLAAINVKTRMIFIANPNNPTGTFVPVIDLANFLERVPDNIIIVIDEAYGEYVTNSATASVLSLLDKHPNLVVVRTFSKFYGLAGMRIGYSMSCSVLSEILNRIRGIVNVNHLALIAASACIDDDIYLTRTFTNNKLGMQQMEEGIEKIGLEYIPSVGNFIAIRFGKNAAQINKKLINRGIIICPLDSYDMPEYLRATIGLPRQNMLLLKSLGSHLEL